MTYAARRIGIGELRLEREATDRATSVLEQQLRAHGGTLLVWLIVLVLHGLALLALPAPRSGHAPPGKPMQLFWIPSGKVSPQQHPAAVATNAVMAAPANAASPPPRTMPAPVTEDVPRSEAPSASGQHTTRQADALGRRRPGTPEIVGQRLGIDALLRQVPGLAQPAPPDTQVIRFDGGRDQVRLPGSDATRMPRLVVRDQVSLDQRVQGVLALVGWGRIDPCPDIRSHVRSAMEAQDPDEVSYWVDREQRCR